MIKVVIVGAGVGGLRAARALSGKGPDTRYRPFLPGVMSNVLYFEKGRWKK